MEVTNELYNETLFKKYEKSIKVGVLTRPIRNRLIKLATTFGGKRKNKISKKIYKIKKNKKQTNKKQINKKQINKKSKKQRFIKKNKKTKRNKS